MAKTDGEENPVEMSQARWNRTREYLAEVFAPEPPAVARIDALAREEGFPAIAVSADVGKLLAFLMKTIGAKRVLEIGTLGGYSTMWMAQALADADDAHLWTLERDDDRAAFARAHLAANGFSKKTTVVSGAALAELPTLLDEVGTLDFVFVDADKRENQLYWDFVTPQLRPGGMFVVDNILGTNAWWIDSDHEEAKVVDQFNRMVAAHPDYDVVGLSQREGLLIARKK